MARDIFITSLDRERLLKLIANEREFGRMNSDNHLHILEKEVTRAQVMSQAEIPSDVVTMNTKVMLKDLDTGEEMDYTLVYPENADFETNRISILAPIGTAILGFREGDVFEWEVPAGNVRLGVVKVLYQPEMAGDFEL